MKSHVICFTAYICVVNYVSLSSSTQYRPWSLSLRYSAFVAFEKVVSRHCKYTRIHAEFPHCTSGQFLFGITDDVRILSVFSVIVFVENAS
jgi:hypothetical protein